MTVMFTSRVVHALLRGQGDGWDDPRHRRTADQDAGWDVPCDVVGARQLIMSILVPICTGTGKPEMDHSGNVKTPEGTGKYAGYAMGQSGNFAS